MINVFFLQGLFVESTTIPLDQVLNVQEKKNNSKLQ